jgi:prepilin-type N-terminal cleavage/methylation domain-containing protein
MKKAFTLIELLIVIAIIAILALIAIPNFMEAQTRAKVARVKADMRSLATAVEAYTVDFRMPPLMDMTKGDVVWQAYSWEMYWESDVLKPYKGCAFALTTPVAYLTGTPPIDPFVDHVMDMSLGNPRGKASYTFFNVMGQYNAQQLPGWNAGTQNLVATGPSMDVYFNSWDYKNATVYHNVSWALCSPGPDRTLMEPPLPGSDGKQVNTAYCLYQGNPWKFHGATCIYDPTNGTASTGNVWRFSGGNG